MFQFTQAALYIVTVILNTLYQELRRFIPCKVHIPWALTYQDETSVKPNKINVRSSDFASARE